MHDVTAHTGHPNETPMDLLVLFPLECLDNFPASKPALRVDSTAKADRLRPTTSSGLEADDASGELDVKVAKLRLDFTKIPALLTLKPN